MSDERNTNTSNDVEPNKQHLTRKKYRQMRLCDYFDISDGHTHDKDSE
ncbi:MAG TPA: hypothetical protein VH500_00515 [Nitrososphaeraceae archaeon]